MDAGVPVGEGFLLRVPARTPAFPVEGRVPAGGFLRWKGWVIVEFRALRVFDLLVLWEWFLRGQIILAREGRAMSY